MLLTVAGIPNRLMMTDFTVQSSFKLNLPPHLIITAASIKLNEIIGQGIIAVPCDNSNNIDGALT